MSQLRRADHRHHQLEAKGVSREGLMESAPNAGFLGSRFPVDGSFQKLYAQKHNPFVYFNSVATNRRVLLRYDRPGSGETAFMAFKFRNDVVL